MIPNWEYKVEHLDEEELDILEKKLNSLGQSGWELTSWDGETGIFKRLQLSLIEPYTGEGIHRSLPEGVKNRPDQRN